MARWSHAKRRTLLTGAKQRPAGRPGGVQRAEKTGRPVSRVLYPAGVQFTAGPSSCAPTGRRPSFSDDGYPPPLAANPRAGRAPFALLFGLAPGGVCLADRSPGRWCALTAPLHPYPVHHEAVCFCGAIRRVSPPGRYPAPCPVEPGLSSPSACAEGAVVRPTRLVTSIHPPRSPGNR